MHPALLVKVEAAACARLPGRDQRAVGADARGARRRVYRHLARGRERRPPAPSTTTRLGPAGRSAFAGSSPSWPVIAASGATSWSPRSLIQLIALATPLCSQVIIDKVIVHQTHEHARGDRVRAGRSSSSSAARSAGCGSTSSSHTGNRVDAVLGRRGVPAPACACRLRYLRAAADRRARRAPERRRDDSRVPDRRRGHAAARPAVPARVPRADVLLQRAGCRW